MALWESTGADQLPFWNTDYDGDTYLYIVHGAVRVEFKETDSDAPVRPLPRPDRDCSGSRATSPTAPFRATASAG